MSITTEVKDWFANEIAILKQQISTLEGAFHKHATTAVEPATDVVAAPVAEVATVVDLGNAETAEPATHV